MHFLSQISIIFLTCCSMVSVTAQNPLSTIMNLALPGRQKNLAASVGIMNIQMKTAFRSGGVELQIVLLLPSAESPYNRTSLLLHYFQANNTSPTKADRIILQTCRNIVSFIYCQFPDISSLYPDFTADRFNTTLPIEPIGDFSGCKYSPGKSRLCYTLTGDNQQLGFVNLGSSQFYPAEALNYLRSSQTLMCYPDPVIYNITFVTDKRLKITGKGLNGDNPPLAKVYSFSLADGRIKCTFPQLASTDMQLISINETSSNSTTKSPRTTTELPKSTTNTIFCDFDNARLIDMLEEEHGEAYLKLVQAVDINVTIRNGNWQYNATVPYPLNNPPPKLDLSVPSYDGPSTEVIVAIVVPVCFISVVIACACVALCSMRYGYSPAMVKAAKHMEKACPGPWKKWMKSPPNEMKLQKDDFTQLLRLLPPDMAEIVQQHQIDSSRVHPGNELGTGYFGIVRSGKLMSPKDAKGSGSSTGDSVKSPGEQIAIKFIQRYTDIDQLKEFFQEAVYMFSFDHANVLGAHGVTSIDSFPAVVLPLMDAGDLRKFVQTASNQITDPLLVDFARQIAKGMQYLADKKMVHRDLAARNCLLSKQRVVKVADFGLSRLCESQDQYYEIPNYMIKTHGRPLPIRWMAPESLEYGTFSEKSDVWAYGVVLWELTTRGARPYPAVESTYLKRHVCEEKQRLPKLPIISDCLYEIMLSCWDEHSSARSTFAELVTITESLLNDPQSSLWLNAANQLQYRDPEELDQQLNQNFEDSLLALSAESTVQTTTSGGGSTSGALTHDDGYNEHGLRINSEVSGAGSELVTTPSSNASQFSAVEYNATDSGLTSTASPNLNRRHSSVEMTMSDYNALSKPPVISQYDRINYSRADSSPEKSREHGSGDVDSVFMTNSNSRPGTPTPPDSAISGMSYVSTPGGLHSRNSWYSRSFSNGANPVKPSPSTDSATSSVSSNGYSSIRRARHNNNKTLFQMTNHRLTPIGTLDSESLSSPTNSTKKHNNNNYDVINENAQRGNNNNMIDR